MNLPDKKYSVIYADPPWMYGNRQYQDSNRPFKPMDDYYSTMEISEIKKLQVKNISENDCLCFMWVTFSHLKEGIEVLESWGFEYKTVAFVWVKKYNNGSFCFNYAPWTLQSTELCLLGVKGKASKLRKIKNIKQLVIAERTKHSQKPDEVRKRIERMCGDVSRIELFARIQVQGWDVFGDDPRLQNKPLEVFSQ